MPTNQRSDVIQAITPPPDAESAQTLLEIVLVAPPAFSAAPLATFPID